MAADRDVALEQINRALAGVNPAAPSTTKFGSLETAVAALAGLQAHEVVAVTVSKAGNLKVRAKQSTRAQTAALLVGVVTEPDELEGSDRAAVSHVEAGDAPACVLLVRDTSGVWQAPRGVASTAGNTALARVAEALGTHTTLVEAHAKAQGLTASGLVAPTMPSTVPSSPLLVLDPRVRRMLRTAVASRPAVMLVGPPGTGKSQMINELIVEIAQDPSVVSMSRPHDALTVTPDESWTTRELVGGESVDDQGRIRFTPGVVLQAIAQDRWLVLDEANRADLDRIFGGLLTWLAGSHVDVGRVSTAPNARPIRLGWTNDAGSITAGTSALTEDVAAEEASGDDTVEYLAGREWRLLGTYNALDAQRVFRFGLALGRRFAHVPVPPPGLDGFAEALEPRLAALPDARRDETRTRVTAIYSAHVSMEAAALGPAIFLDIPSYVAAAPEDVDVAEVLAEAYLTATGTWLARLEDDQLDTLVAALRMESCLGRQAVWVRDQLPALR